MNAKKICTAHFKQGSCQKKLPRVMHKFEFPGWGGGSDRVMGSIQARK